MLEYHFGENWSAKLVSLVSVLAVCVLAGIIISFVFRLKSLTCAAAVCFKNLKAISYYECRQGNSPLPMCRFNQLPAYIFETYGKLGNF